MPFQKKYAIPSEVLEKVAAGKLGCSQVGRLYNCEPTTVRAQVKALHRIPAADRSSLIAPGRGGDEEFDRLIGERRFEDVTVRTGERFIPVSRPNTTDASLTGCAAGMCAI